MYRRKKAKKRYHYGIFILCILFIIFGIKGIESKNRNTETFQTVQESELEDLLSLEETEQADYEESVKDIRVLIMGNQYRGEVHSKVKMSSKSRMSLSYGDNTEYIEPGQIFEIEPDDDRFKRGKIRISSDNKIKIHSLKRADGIPAYRGIIELRDTVEGIVIINELSVEDYLKAVVPSEMPASYELEALKAQAVCARSYAYQQMTGYGYPEYEAHVNDSTEYQVYGNVKPQEKTNQAINKTKGQVVYYNDEITTTYYFSTSCGKTTDIRAWGTKKNSKNAYLKSVNVTNKKGDYEKNLPWYRWKADIPVQILSDLIGINTGKDIGGLEKIEVTKRGAGNVAIEMDVIGEKGTVTVKTENKIRTVLGGQGYEIVLNDGSVTASRELLPSAFFTIEKEGEVFVIEGGGLGHGIGMSQNGANEMAKQGADYEEILQLFYKDIEIRKVDKK